jgi:biopolymer transport protein ExbB
MSMLKDLFSLHWNPTKKTALLLLLVAVALILAQTCFAEEATAGGVAKGKKSWFDLFKQTGPVGVLLLLLSICGFALVIEHVVNLRQDKIAPPDLYAQLDEALETGDTERAYEACQARDTYLARVVKAGLEAGGTGEAAIEAAREVAGEETFSLNTKISYLSLVGNIAPLLGLLGTVTGMITSFQKIEQLKAPTPGDLAAGVYESLVNTTMGLFAAIIFLTAYFVFKNKVTKMTISANNNALLLLRDRAAA